MQRPLIMFWKTFFMRQDQLNTGVIRYAELLLIDAEANIESESGDLARAKRDLDEIRARVNMPELKVSDREGLRSALRYESKVELAGEGFRWLDIRSGPMTAVSAMRTEC